MPALVALVATLLRFRARACVVLACVAAMLCTASIASANPSVQPKTRVWYFSFAEPLNTWLERSASPRTHPGNQLAQADLASASLLAAEGAAPLIEATELTGVQANKVIGDAAADELAESLRQAGLTVEREVPYRTPIGTRIADLRVSDPNGAVRGLVEVKVGNSPYTAAQQLKDWFIQSIYGHPTNVVRY